MESLKIRPAERKDCVTIVNLIKELAEYEKMLEKATMTPEGRYLHKFTEFNWKSPDC